MHGATIRFKSTVPLLCISLIISCYTLIITPTNALTIKTAHAQQAKLNNNYKLTKLKLLKANAAIWFNKMCKFKQLKPSHINIKINGQKPQDKKTTINAIRSRINQDAIALVSVIIKVILQTARYNNEDSCYMFRLDGQHQGADTM